MIGILYLVAWVGLLVVNCEESTTVAESSSETSSEAAPETSSEAPPASAVTPATEATPPTAVGCVARADDSQPGDIIHPNLNSWKEALTAKKEKIKADMAPADNDDASTVALKGRFKTQMTQVENMMADDKLMANPNQMDIAYTMAKIESVLNTIGRNMYGINWRTKGCGAGFILTTECGNQVNK